MNLQEALDAYLLQIEADGRSPHTIGQYRRHVRAFEQSLLRHGHAGDVAAVRHEDIARFLAAPNARACADGHAKKATSMNALRTSLRTFFSYLHEAGVIHSNPARLVRRALCGTAPPRALADDDCQRLLGLLAGGVGPEARRDEMLVRLLLGAGLRIGSALALDVTDVDLRRGELNLRTAKGNRPVTVYLSADLVARLGAFIAERTDGPLFAARSGDRITTRHAARRIREAVRAAGIKVPASPHSLRHTMATNLLKQTGNLALVQAALCHRSIASTLVYARVDPERVKAAVNGAP